MEHKAFCKLPRPSTKRCKYYNLSCGCLVEKCTFPHVCFQCGKNHKWVDVHYGRAEPVR